MEAGKVGSTSGRSHLRCWWLDEWVGEQMDEQDSEA